MSPIVTMIDGLVLWESGVKHHKTKPSITVTMCLVYNYFI